MHLISVDLPAPLSPTSAITSPSRTSKSTSLSACTEPNAFEMARSSSVGVVVATESQPRGSGRSGQGRSAPRRFLLVRLLAVLRVLAVAHLALLQELVLEENLV